MDMTPARDVAGTTHAPIHFDCANAPGLPCDLTDIGSFIDKSSLFEEVRVHRCKRCGLGVSHPPIPDVAYLYGERESQDYQPDARGGLAHTIKNIAFRREARKLLRQIGRPFSRALDFGCGSGQFTRVFDSCAGSAQVIGSDFFDSPPAELEGHGYLPSDTLAADAEGFDLVTAFHVLEHDDDAAALLARITGPARPGATVVIEVPNVECIWNSVFGKYWDGWYMPYHRHHFSRASLLHLLDRGGLDVREVIGQTSPTMGRTMANFAGQKNNLFWLLLGVALHPVQWLGEVLTGQQTSLRVISTKR